MTFVDFARLKRPASPNTFLVAPEGVCLNAKPDAVAPQFDQSPQALHAIAGRVIRDGFKPAAVDDDPERLALHFVAVTPLLRFKDDVDLLILPVAGEAGAGGNRSTLAIYSRSRVGYSDLGANAKRVGRLLEMLSAATQTT